MLWYGRLQRSRDDDSSIVRLIWVLFTVEIKYQRVIHQRAEVRPQLIDLTFSRCSGYRRHTVTLITADQVGTLDTGLIILSSTRGTSDVVVSLLYVSAIKADWRVSQHSFKLLRSAEFYRSHSPVSSSGSRRPRGNRCGYKLTLSKYGDSFYIACIFRSSTKLSTAFSSLIFSHHSLPFSRTLPDRS